jgi:hypothetical protein
MNANGGEVEYPGAAKGSGAGEINMTVTWDAKNGIRHRRLDIPRPGASLTNEWQKHGSG